MDPQPVPLQISCLGCKRYFLIDERLPLESMTVEFKNYSFPIKESFLKDNILKTIVGFLNSKGGTIFMGVNDSNGSVNGVSLGRKQMDEFKLMIKQMLQKIQPSVDLIKCEEVSVDFVPVLEGKERAFYGKYVVKFIVLQGDPSKLYCLSQRVRVSGAKTEDIQVISAFRRHNLGGVQEIKGIRVIHQIYEKARNPHRQAKTFHQNCNPSPLCPMLAVRQKPENNQRIFADQQGSKKSFSSQSNNQNELSEKQSIIEYIKKADKQKVKEKKLFIKRDDPIFIFFKNVRSDSIKSFINFLKNSTIAKNSLQICGLNDIVRVKFSSESQKECLIEQLSKSSMKKLVDGFGHNDKVQIAHSLESSNKDYENKLKTQKNQEKVYLLIFHGYDSGTEGSIQNYLQKCMTSSIERKMKKTRQGLEFEFKSRKDMFVFESMCKKSPHSNQLDKFWPKGKALIKISSRGQNQRNIKQEQSNAKGGVKMQEERFPSLLSSPVLAQLSSDEIQPVELIASSLDLTQVPKLSNYLTNNMFYNIQKKLFLSKEKYYIRVIFNQPQDCKKFLQYCQLEQHKNILAQFVSSKTLRIGIPGDNLLIFPYTDQLKEKIKKMVLKVLGQGVIKTSSVKLINNETKVWSLSLVDNSKILQAYQKLQIYMRKSPLFFNQEWTLFKVFLDYKDFKE